MSSPWWAQQPSTAFRTATNLRLSTGARDVEKGSIFSVPAGTDISLPEKTKLLWADSQHAVLEDDNGNFLNLLHVNTYARTGDVIPANTPFARVSALVGSTTDPRSGIPYIESGNIVELGLYDSQERAISRENIVDGQDRAYDFTGIFDPTHMLNDWKRGIFTKNYTGGNGTDLGPATFMGLGNNVILLVIVALTLILLVRA